MPRLTIDGQQVEAPSGDTLLQAAQRAGIAIPTLCHAPGVRPLTSCMMCVVEETSSGRMLPACCAKVEGGMVVETFNDAIRAARREVLQLLLSEHAGDCEAPCRRVCPASMDIPAMLRHVAQGDMAGAARIAARDLVLPATLGRVCEAPCEKGCRRAAYDEAVAIRELHRQVAETALQGDAFPLPGITPTGKSVAVVGAGPSGLAAARVLRGHGHACRIFERHAEAGGPLRRIPEDKLPRRILDAEIDVLRRIGVVFEMEREISRIQELRPRHDAVILACDSLGVEGEGVFFSAPEKRVTVRAVASGKAAAERAHGVLQGGRTEAYGSGCDSRLRRLGPDEVGRYAAGRLDAEALARPRRPEHAREEAGRCFHCDCHKPTSCKLRRYAAEYDAKPRAYEAAEGAPLEVTQQGAGVFYEAGKCIKCGLCVEITREAGEELGLTFVGRGIDVRVSVPFDGMIEEGLKLTARQCVEACPTGALAFRDWEERDV